MQTFRAVLNGDRLEWLDQLPHPQCPVEVKILVEELPEKEREQSTTNAFLNRKEMDSVRWDVSCDRPVPSRFE